MRRYLVKSSLILAVAGVFFSNAPEPLTVTLPSGRLEGIRFSGSPDGVAFLGVPYAAPPVGELRWKPPRPGLQWAGLRKADAFGPVCPQPRQGWLPYLEGQEDCLYLNVWTPQLPSNAKLPVIVFFHGGSNTAGYSQFTPLGPPLAQLGAVIVTANYRLGPFGFLAHPALTAESEHHSSGNYGLLDQIQALHWVRENISRFGGDPARVTVMGQSSGAVDICLLMSSPLAKDLFLGAILESGECQSTLNEDIRQPLPFNFIEDTGEAVGERLASDLGAPSGRNALEKLRSTPPDAILKAWSQDPHVHFDAIVDGWVVPEQPAKLFSDGKQLHVPILIGSNADEATVFGDHGVKTVEQYRKYLEQDSGRFAGQEFAAYPVTSDAGVPARRLELENDSFAYGAYSMALAMTQAGQKAYLYDFTFSDTGKRAHLGAHHGLELSFLSDSFPSEWVRSVASDQLGAFLRGYWAQFAKTGDPNYRGAPSWPVFDSGAEQCLELGHDIRVRAIEPRLRIMQHVMLEVLAEASTLGNKPN
jgi:para-nitrobenzyl esterase